MNLRIGHGYDLHRLTEGRPCILGGIEIPSEKGPAGHSDGDPVLHAIIDAILGASGNGDIGEHFPDSDDAWKDARSSDLLTAVVDLIPQWRIVNVDVTIITELPKIGPVRDVIRESVAGLLMVSSDLIGVKAKTNEGIDAIGAGDAIACHAVVLLEGRDDGEEEAWV